MRSFAPHFYYFSLLETFINIIRHSLVSSIDPASDADKIRPPTRSLSSASLYLHFGDISIAINSIIRSLAQHSTPVFPLKNANFPIFRSIFIPKNLHISKIFRIFALDFEIDPITPLFHNCPKIRDGTEVS